MSKKNTPILGLLVCGVFAFACNKSGPPPGPRASLPVLTDRGFYSVDVNNNNSSKGEILMAMNSKTAGNLFFLNERGTMVRKQSIGVQVENLQKWNFGSKTMYSYFHSKDNILLDGIIGTELGYEYICDSSLNILDSVKLKSFGPIHSEVQDKLDVHEFILLGENHYICQTYLILKPDNIPDSLHPAFGVRVAACIIQEVRNGTVIFQWNGADYPELYSSSKENNQFNDISRTLDYMHLNSICVDPRDNNLILSFRNMDEVIKINRQSGDILWRLGGTHSDFQQNTDQQFLRQHFVRLTDNNSTLILLDNGLENVRQTSRVLEFHLNEVNKQILSFRSFTIPDLWIQFAGSVQKTEDTYFIGGGSANYTLEVDYLTTQKLLRLNQQYNSYRSLKY